MTLYSCRKPSVGGSTAWHERVFITDLDFLMPYTNQHVSPSLIPQPDGSVVLCSATHNLLASVHPDQPHAKLLPFPLRKEQACFS